MNRHERLITGGCGFMDQMYRDTLILVGWVTIIGVCYYVLSRRSGRKKHISGEENDDAP